jgi:hypothetical protein
LFIGCPPNSDPDSENHSLGYFLVGLGVTGTPNLNNYPIGCASLQANRKANVIPFRRLIVEVEQLTNQRTVNEMSNVNAGVYNNFTAAAIDIDTSTRIHNPQTPIAIRLQTLNEAPRTFNVNVRSETGQTLISFEDLGLYANGLGLPSTILTSGPYATLSIPVPKEVPLYFDGIFLGLTKDDNRNYTARMTRAVVAQCVTAQLYNFNVMLRFIHIYRFNEKVNCRDSNVQHVFSGTGYF